MSPIFLTALLDVDLHNILQLHELPYFTGYGFPLMILGLPFALATRFAAARTQAEDLNPIWQAWLGHALANYPPPIAPAHYPAPTGKNHHGSRDRHEDGRLAGC